MRVLGIILTVSGILLAAGATLLIPTRHPPLTQVEELQRSTERLNALTGSPAFDPARLERVEKAGQVDPVRVEKRARLTVVGLAVAGIGAILILAGTIASVARRQQV